MIVAHLMASPFFGGPEKQMLGLALHLPAEYQSVFLTFAEGGKCAALMAEVRRHGLEGRVLEHNFPNLLRATREVADTLRELHADILVCSGYKPDIIGWRAARRAGIPVVAVAHGWTAASWRVCVYEQLDRWVCRHVDAAVGVSEAQGRRLEEARVPREKIAVIANAVGEDAFAPADPAYADKLAAYFPRRPRCIVGAAGRLSPEKGFDQLIEAARLLKHEDFGVVIFGDGPLRRALRSQIEQCGLQERVILAGFCADVGRFLPHLDVAVLPSYTEGLPVVVLEELAAGVPVVATDVGGVPEVIVDGDSGLLVGPGNSLALAGALRRLLLDSSLRRDLAARGQARVREHFTCAAQAQKYRELFEKLTGRRPRHSQQLTSAEA